MAAKTEDNTDANAGFNVPEPFSLPVYEAMKLVAAPPVKLG